MQKNRRRFLFSSSSYQPLPWVKADVDFFEHCSRCGDCLRACEMQLIVMRDGGFPTIDFDQGGCDFCYGCAGVCTVQLFKNRNSKAWHQKITLSSDCLAYQGVECRSCADSCEAQAIRFQRQPKRVSQPVLDLKSCSGCGACISSCPTRAISMENSNE